MDWIAPLIALTSMEIVLGIDNIIFIAILAQRLPEAQQGKARTIGLLVALGMRLLLLSAIKWIMGLTKPLFQLTDFGLPEAWVPGVGTNGEHLVEIDGISVRDLILIVGGAFLIWKSVREIHHKVADDEEEHDATPKHATMGSVLVQIMLLDIVFSLDSVITAVGMADDLRVMMAAVIISVGFMLFAAGPVSRFVQKHPTLKILALSFLILIGFTLVVEGFGQHISKGYIYFAMVFALIVEGINMRVRKRVVSPSESARRRQESLQR